MKVKQISCTQFAGVRDLDIALHGGLDLIYGKMRQEKAPWPTFLRGLCSKMRSLTVGGIGNLWSAFFLQLKRAVLQAETLWMESWCWNQNAAVTF